MKTLIGFTLFFLLALMSRVYAESTVPSYQESLDAFIEKSKASKSKFTDEDKKVMQASNESLAEKLPDPGVKVGEMAPDFSLKNPLGDEVTLSEELKKGPVVLVFYRGAWCPFCNMHLHVLKQSLPEFEKFNAQLIAITPQQPDKSAKQIEKDGYPFHVLTDADSAVMKDYRLYFELSEDLLAVYKRTGLDIEAFNGKGRTALPIPGTFVIDQKGVVQAMHAPVDYKSRMEPAEILRSLESLAKAD